jgi:pimeloyl-ACP methyl ester carboxylesterase
VLLVHGWGGRAGQMAAFAPALLEAGCSVVTFDAPAHGASSGRLASVPLFADAVATVAQRVRAQAAIAHSMGAAGTALALLQGLSLRAAVFVGPPRNPASFFQRFCEVLELRPALQDAVRRRLEERFGIALSRFDIPHLAGDVATPLLVIHDRSDAEVAWEDGAAIAEAWPGARLVTTEGLGHRRVLRDGAVVAGAAEFVVDRLPRCACGTVASYWDGAEWRCAGCFISAELWDRSARHHHVALERGWRPYV